MITPGGIMTQPLPPAGWYDDQTDASVQRWWDGTQWTEATRPHEPAAPAPAPQPQPVVQPQPVAQPKHAAQSRSEEKVSFFGARGRVKELAAENDELRRALDRVGGMSLIEAERRRDEAQNEAERLRAEASSEAERLRTEAQREAERTIAEARRDVEQLLAEAATQRAEVTRLAAELVDARRGIAIQELGLYDFEHPAEESATLANQLAALRLEIKQTVATGGATVATENFTYNNSVPKGRKFVKDMSKTMLAAYNAEAENCIKTVRAGGLETARIRLSKVVDRVEKNGSMIDLRITSRYHNLRLDELALAARHLEAVKAAKEAERERRAELREQKKVEDELRRERERLQKERDHYANALAALQARGDVAGAEALQAKLADVDKALVDVDYREANIRAGYVYVISNVGAFGERMVKIGMTRRLDPMDRIRELGDASVPFRFDVHALFFAENAVGIEAMLHRDLAGARVNRMNPRREFFYVTPAEVLEALREHDIAVVEFKTEPDAEEFRLSQAVAAQSSEAQAVPLAG